MREQYEIFSVSFKPDAHNISKFKLSNKIKLNSDLILNHIGKDGRWESNEVHIVRPLTGKHLDLYDSYVYDITTETGTFYSQGMIQHNCFNYSCLDIAAMGLPMINKIKSLPPKNLFAFKSQIEQFVTIVSNSIAGACGLSDLLLVMSYYVKQILTTKSDSHFKFQSEDDCWTYVKETLISMIYTLNQPMRGDQSPFTNVSVYDRYFLEESLTTYIFPDGSSPDIDIINTLQDVFLEAMNEELSRTIFTFPVITACVAVDELGNVRDETFLKFIAKHDRKFGFINIFIGDSALLSSCCRLKSNRKNEYFNSIGGSSSKIGSIGVCTINLPRLGFKFKDDPIKFYDELHKLVEVTGKINNSKRHIIKQKIDEGFMPLYSMEFMSLDKQYSTTGINGMYECLTYRGFDILTESGQQEAIKMMDFINSIIDIMETQYKSPHNVEQVPAEGAAYKLAEKDRLLGFNTDYKLYSNQFIPLITNADLLDRIHIQGLLDDKFSGGSILHVNVDTEVTEDQIIELIKTCAANRVRYFGINYQLNECAEGHISNGKLTLCPICRATITDHFHRVVGYIVNTKNFSKIRREYEYPERKFYQSTD